MTPLDPASAAVDVLARWTRAFSDADVAGIVDLYAEDALFLGTSSKTGTQNRADVRAYFERALLHNRPRSAAIDERTLMVLAEDVVVASGLDTVTGNKEGQTYAIRGRFTFVIQRRTTGWKIVHFHRSALPP